jgi:hypothetical protein
MRELVMVSPRRFLAGTPIGVVFLAVVAVPRIGLGQVPPPPRPLALASQQPTPLPQLAPALPQLAPDPPRPAPPPQQPVPPQQQPVPPQQQPAPALPQPAPAVQEPVQQPSQPPTVATALQSGPSPAGPTPQLPAAVTHAAPGASSPRASSLPSRLYIRDGQLKSHMFTVFVTDRIEDSMQPRIVLGGSHWNTNPLAWENREIVPRITAPGQTRTVVVDGTQIQAEGTILLFDLSAYDVHFYESAVRLLPILQWNPPAAVGASADLRRIVADEEVYLGNLSGAVLWTSGAMIFVTLILLGWSKSKSKELTTQGTKWACLLLTGSDGYLSLWRTQLMLWTYSVGSLVFLFGLVQLKVPEIPDSLVALMGLSLVTGLAAKGGAPSQPTAAAGATLQTPTVPVPPRMTGPEWGDLISTWNGATGRMELSIPKAQMVLWTLVVLALFCTKTVLGGTLWPVPWELVALTGISQAGYVSDKFVPTK